ncbi:MAG: single-stranded DNA-binding protein [Bacteroidetes bacterium]|nr:MAG: single-stranded DNA-binding protein [Bacteroidota bacterium]
MTIHEKLSKIQKEFKAKKSRFNSFGKYNFRSAEDILEALKPYNEKYNVYFKVDENYLGDAIIESTATIVDAEGAMEITASAIVGVDLNQKGMQVPQQFGSASSYGKKYALGNLLLIDDTADADATNTHGKEVKAKPTLDINTDAFTKAKQYIESGGTLKAINQKYKLTQKALAELKKLETVEV